MISPIRVEWNLKILINYADSNFKKQQRINSKTGLKIGGFDKVIEYRPEKLGDDFYDKHSSFIKNNKRGAGYWIWKPYIILDTLLKRAKENDYVFYSDSGAMFINSVDYLVEALENSNQDIFITELPLIEYQWTKRECFLKLDCYKDEFVYSNQLQATFLLIKRTNFSINFAKEYYELCSDYSLINDDFDPKINNDLIDHRHDQSVLSLLAKKMGIKPFRDITQYGLRPWQYVSPNREYHIKSYNNSNYPQILSLYRRDDWRKVLIKEKIKNKLGFTLRI